MSESALRTVRDLVRWAASELGRAGVHFGHGTDNALDEAAHLVGWSLKLPLALPEECLDARVTGAERAALRRLVRRRIRTRRPAAYLTGEAWFAGLPFTVDERVLVPRSPIAELIGQRFRPWLARRPRRILDLCAGSGCIAVACAHRFPRAAVDAVELDGGALAVLRANVRRHRMGRRVRAIRSDLFAGLAGERYDLIVSNPPYVPAARWRALPREYRHEPRIGLEAGPDGLAVVRRIVAEAAAHLEPGGVLVCEVGGGAQAFERAFPALPVVWPEFEHGGEGVFVVSREELAQGLAPAARLRLVRG